MNKNYNLYCEFDLKKHKETFVNYLEVIIDKEGKVHYAFPSHQEYLITMACETLNKTREELNIEIPQSCNVIAWLCCKLNAIAVWDNFYIGAANEKQREVIEILKEEDLFHGI